MNLLLVFARYPVVGSCKTRLIPAVGPEGAAAIHSALTRHTLLWAGELSERTKTDVEVHFHGGDTAAMRREFGERFRYVPQINEVDGQPADLGQKMRAAFSQSEGDGKAGKIVVVGTDCPELNSTIAEAAFQRLDSHDVCFAPASDGGYTLLGLNLESLRAKPNPGHSALAAAYDALFSKISWGTDEVMSQSISALEHTGASIALLRTLRDIDDPEDLAVWEPYAAEALNGAWQSADNSAAVPKLSVVIPAHGFEEDLHKVLDRAKANSDAEIIVAISSRQFDTLRCCISSQVQMIQSVANRSQQMNAGARVARAQTLLFLHADTLLPADYGHAVDEQLAGVGVCAGAFRLKIASDTWRARLVEAGVQFRSRYRQLPYGDQAMFVSRDVFEEVGGFPDQPIMEDYALMKLLRPRGRIAIADAAVTTSARRWQQVGFLKTTLINQLMILGYRMGVAPARLATFYRRKRT